MSYTNIIFIFSFIILLAIYFITPIRFRWKVLLAASIGFFGSRGWKPLLIAIVSTGICYLTAARIQLIYESADAGSGKKKLQKKANAKGKDGKKKRSGQPDARMEAKICLAAGIILLAGVLVITKIKRFIPINSISQMIIVPLGISYYTMSLIGYLADVYWKKEKAEKNFFKLLLFALYFPKIIEGPISKHRLIAGQLNEGHEFDYKRVCFGLQRCIWGFFKKLVIADRLGLFTSTVFADIAGGYGADLLVAVFFSAIQLYCDFSGCMDMALGMSECFGITIEENFKRPFFSKTAAEFWRRWHMTLGVWFKDYIYMPLVINPNVISLSGKVRNRFGKRAGKAVMSVIPLAVTWMLTGLWHGTGANYILWGVYWGLIIILSSIFERELKLLAEKMGIETASKGYEIFQILRTFILFMISRIISVPGTIADTVTIFKQIFTNFGIWRLVDGTLYTLGMDRPNFILAVISILILRRVSIQQERGTDVREWIAERNIAVRWIIYYSLIFSVIIFGIYGPGYDASSFVYMQF